MISAIKMTKKNETVVKQMVCFGVGFMMLYLLVNSMSGRYTMDYDEDDDYEEHIPMMYDDGAW